MYSKAGRQTEAPAGPEPEPLQLSIKHTTAVFGTDFDVVVEVRVPAAAGRRCGGVTFDSERLCAGEERPEQQRRRRPDGPGQGGELHLSVPRGVPQAERQRERARSLRLARRVAPPL